MTPTTLRQVLAGLGYTIRTPNMGIGIVDVLDRAGVVVFKGRAHQCWAWLREQGWSS